MRKPWVYKRKGITGWWCGWYEGGKRKAKALPNRTLAEHFRHMRYVQLNSEVFISSVDCDWHQMVKEYRRFKQVEGLREASIYEAILTLEHFNRLAGSDSSKAITQDVCFLTGPERRIHCRDSTVAGAFQSAAYE